MTREVIYDAPLHFRILLLRVADVLTHRETLTCLHRPSPGVGSHHLWVVAVGERGSLVGLPKRRAEDLSLDNKY